MKRRLNGSGYSSAQELLGEIEWLGYSRLNHLFLNNWQAIHRSQGRAICCKETKKGEEEEEENGNHRLAKKFRAFSDRGKHKVPDSSRPECKHPN